MNSEAVLSANHYGMYVVKKGLKQLHELLDLVLENIAILALPYEQADEDLPIGNELHCYLSTSSLQLCSV